MAENITPAKAPEMVAINSNDSARGTVQVWDKVIIEIVKKYALTIEGVARPAPQSLSEGLSNILSRKPATRSIALELTDEGCVVTLALILYFGVNIPSVSKAIQDVLFEKIPAISGCAVSKVNVNVVDLEEEKPAEEEEEAAVEAPTTDANQP